MALLRGASLLCENITRALQALLLGVEPVSEMPWTHRVARFRQIPVGRVQNDCALQSYRQSNGRCAS